MTKLAIRVSTAADLADVHPDTIRRRIKDGTLKAKLVCGLELVDYASFLKMLGIEEHAALPPKPKAQAA